MRFTKRSLSIPRILLLCVTALFLCCQAAASETGGDVPPAPIPSPLPAGAWVYDFEGTIGHTTETIISRRLSDLYVDTNAEMVVVTVDGFEGMAPERYALWLFDRWGLETADKESSILLLFSLREQAIHLLVGSGIEHIFPGDVCGGILDQYAMPYLMDGDTDTGLLKTVEEVCRFYTMEALGKGAP